MKVCVYCNKILTNHQYKYCAIKCQFDYQYREYIHNWKGGKLNNIQTRNISKYLRRYLLEKSKGKCSQCGWNKVNPITKRSALEVDHKDGNSENNSELNLRILCPNCHSLTTNFKNLNKGMGRKWRIEKLK